MKDMILVLIMCLQPESCNFGVNYVLCIWESAERAPGSKGCQPNVLLGDCLFAFHRSFISCKTSLFCSWSIYSEKSNAKKKNCAHSASSLFPLFCFSGTLWTLQELPVNAGTGTCEQLGFVMKGGLKNKCLDIQLQFSCHGFVSKINSAQISS